VLSLNPPILAANPRRRSRPSADRRLSKGSTLRLRCERGQSAAEYVGILLVVVAVVGVIATSGIGDAITRGIANAICSVSGTACAERSGGRDRAGADRARDGASPADRGLDGAGGVNELGLDGGEAPEPFDPPTPDPGAGEYDSEGAGVGDRLNKEKWYRVADAAEALGLTDAARHMRHYLGDSGEPLEIDVDAIIHDEERLRSVAGNLVGVAAAQALEDYDGSMPVDIPFRTPWRSFNAETNNWFYGLGGMSASVTGVLHIEPGNPPRVTATYRVHVHDRYNWDGGKSTEIGPFTVKDTELAELHRKGLAREYDVSGTSDEITVTIDPSDPGAAAPPAGGGRDGGRSDPGRSRG
jgi:hypothetical protein